MHSYFIVIILLCVTLGGCGRNSYDIQTTRSDADNYNKIVVTNNKCSWSEDPTIYVDNNSVWIYCTNIYEHIILKAGPSTATAIKEKVSEPDLSSFSNKKRSAKMVKCDPNISKYGICADDLFPFAGFKLEYEVPMIGFPVAKFEYQDYSEVYRKYYQIMYGDSKSSTLKTNARSRYVENKIVTDVLNNVLFGFNAENNLKLLALIYNTDSTDSYVSGHGLALIEKAKSTAEKLDLCEKIARNGYFNVNDAEYYRLLLDYIKSNRHELINILLKSGLDSNISHSKSGTLLASAVTMNNIAVTRRLIDSGASVQSEELLLSAVTNNNLEMIRLLKSKGAKLPPVYANALAAAKKSDIPTTDYWLYKAVQLELVNNNEINNVERVIGPERLRVYKIVSASNYAPPGGRNFKVRLSYKASANKAPELAAKIRSGMKVRDPWGILNPYWVTEFPAEAAYEANGVIIGSWYTSYYDGYSAWLNQLTGEMNKLEGEGVLKSWDVTLLGETVRPDYSSGSTSSSSSSSSSSANASSANKPRPAAIKGVKRVFNEGNNTIVECNDGDKLKVARDNYGKCTYPGTFGSYDCQTAIEWTRKMCK